MAADDRFDVVYVGFLTGHGGDANQMLLLADGMHRDGARVKVIVPRAETSVGFAERAAELGLECERTGAMRADPSGPRQRADGMVRLMNGLRAPVVHFHTGNSCLPRSAMAALRLARADRAFVTIQSPYETIKPGSWRAKLWAQSVRRRVDAVVSPSDHGSAFQRACGVRHDQAVTIRNSIDVDAVSSGDGGPPRRELGVGDDTPLVVFTSRLDPQKRPADAVRIFARATDDLPEAVLVFVGTGSETETVRSVAAELGVADRVRCVGHRTDVADWLAASTAWILPTERENFSVAVLEALAAGCAVVSTPCRGNDEVLVDGENALVFGIGDLEAGANALRRALRDDRLRAELRTRGVEYGRRFSVDHMVDEYARLYQNPPATSPGVDSGAQLRATRA